MADEWTGEEVIEALQQCHRTDAPVWFRHGDHDLTLRRVETEGGELCFVFEPLELDDEPEF